MSKITVYSKKNYYKLSLLKINVRSSTMCTTIINLIKINFVFMYRTNWKKGKVLSEISWGFPSPFYFILQKKSLFTSNGGWLRFIFLKKIPAPQNNMKWNLGPKPTSRETVSRSTLRLRLLLITLRLTTTKKIWFVWRRIYRYDPSAIFWQLKS